MKVEVELEDLETIIYATAAIKLIENVLVSRKQDPFVQPHLNYKQAHDNLVAAMNGAKRGTADTIIPWDGALTKDELKILGELYIKRIKVLSADDRLTKSGGMSEYDVLMAKGCVRLGQQVIGAVWPGDTQADVKPTSY